MLVVPSLKIFVPINFFLISNIFQVLLVCNTQRPVAVYLPTCPCYLSSKVFMDNVLEEVYFLLCCGSVC